MSILVIVESPNKAKTIQKYLGSNYDVRASVGHIRDLPEKALGIDLESFDAEYVTSPGKSKVIAGLKKRAAEADDVILATDLDREGEAIAWHLEKVLKLKNAKRMVFNEITKPALQEALKNTCGIDYKRVDAQQGRRIIDRFVGWMVSGEISRQRGQALSAGRVQSVAVRLIVELCHKVRSFRSIDHFGAELTFGPGNWKAKWHVESSLPPGETHCLNQSLASQVAAIRQVQVVTYSQKPSNESPPAPLTTSTLIQRASKELSLSSSKTMAAAQALFEQGLISYHRTDSPNLSSTAFEAIREYAQGAELPVLDEQRLWKSKESAQEAHEAIRPTDFKLLTTGEGDIAAVYGLIWRHAVGSQLQSAVWEERRATLTGQAGTDCVTFKANGRRLTSPGWRVLLQAQADDDDDSKAEMNNPVPELQPGQLMQATDGRLLQLKTKPPALFTEATLVKELEDRGIGRPSTYASIISNIQKRQYVKVTKGRFEDTELGRLVVASLVGQFSFMDFDFTRKMEELLDAIAQGNVELKTVLRGFYGRLTKELGGVKIEAAPTYPCPDCGKPLSFHRKGNKGPWWGCSGYKEGCKVTLSDDKGKPGALKAVSTASDVTCPSCKQGTLIRHRQAHSATTKGYDFFGCNRVKDGCKFTCNVLDGQPMIGTTA